VAYHRPVQTLQHGLTPKSIVDARHKRSGDEQHNANIVQLVSELVDSRRMVGDGVISCTHTKAHCSAEKEAAEGEHIARRRLCVP
jgi:hypothetical protein